MSEKGFEKEVFYFFNGDVGGREGSEKEALGLETTVILKEDLHWSAME